MPNPNKCLLRWVLFLSNAETTEGWKDSALYRRRKEHSFSELSSEFSLLCAKLAPMWCSCVILEKNCVRTDCETSFPQPLSYSGVVVMLSPLPLILASATLQLCLWLTMDFDPDLIWLIDFLVWPQAWLIPVGLPHDLHSCLILLSVAEQTPSVFCAQHPTVLCSLLMRTLPVPTLLSHSATGSYL